MASYRPGDPYVVEFTTSNPTTGAATNADSLPVATADFDGSGTGTMTLAVTNPDAGRYKVSGTIPGTRVSGDILNTWVAATVGGIAGKAPIDNQVLDTHRVGDISIDGSGRLDVGKIVGNATAATALAAQMGAQFIATVNDTSPAVGSFKGASSLSSSDNFYNGQILAFTAGAIPGQARKITGYTGATRLFAFATPFPTVPANADPFVILGFLP